MVCSSQKRTTSPNPSFFHLTRVICVGLRSHRLFLVCFVMTSLSSLFTSCLGSHANETLQVTLLKDRISLLAPTFSASYNLSTPSSSFAMFSEPWVQECFVNVSIGTGLHKTSFVWDAVSLWVSILEPLVQLYVFQFG